MPRRAGSRPIRHRQGGHTLWEMLLVLALLGVVTAIVAPSFGLRPPARQDSVTATTTEILAMLARARLTALDRGTAVDVLIDPATARVWTFSVERGERRLITAGTLPLAGGATLIADTPRVRFTFDAGGTASGGPVIVSGIEGARVVTVDPWSGVADAAAR